MLVVLVSRQIRTRFAPAEAAVVRAQKDVGAVVDHGRIMAGNVDRRVPVEAVALITGLHAEPLLLVGLHRPYGSRARVELLYEPQIAPCVGQLGVLRVEGNVCALTAAVYFPIVAANAAVAGATVYGDGGVVLLATVDAVLELLVGVHAVELGGGLIVLT